MLLCYKLYLENLTEDLTVKYEIIAKCRSETKTGLLNTSLPNKGNSILASQILLNTQLSSEY